MGGELLATPTAASVYWWNKSGVTLRLPPKMRTVSTLRVRVTGWDTFTSFLADAVAVAV